MSDTEEKQAIASVGDLIDALHYFPGDARISINCMDGADRVYLTYNKKFNYLMVSG